MDPVDALRYDWFFNKYNLLIMQIMESIYLAIDSIKSNKLRSALTLLGVGIGLFSIIIVMTAIGAIEKSVVDAFNSIGSNNFIIQKMPAIRMGGRSEEHTSELQSHSFISYAVFCLKKKK